MHALFIWGFPPVSPLSPTPKTTQQYFRLLLVTKQTYYLQIIHFLSFQFYFYFFLTLLHWLRFLAQYLKEGVIEDQILKVVSTFT